MSRTRGLSFFSSRNKRSVPNKPVVIPRAMAAPQKGPTNGSDALVIARLARIEAKLDRVLLLEGKVDQLIEIMTVALDEAGAADESASEQVAHDDAQGLTTEEEQPDEQTQHDAAMASEQENE